MEMLIRLNRLEVESSVRFCCDGNVSSNSVIIPGQLSLYNPFHSEMFVITEHRVKVGSSPLCVREGQVQSSPQGPVILVFFFLFNLSLPSANSGTVIQLKS